MAITTPTGIQISSASQLWLPAMAQEPLLTALKNCNYLMQFHRPPLISLCPTNDARSNVYIIPIMPSADGLNYDFEHRFLCSAASQSITVTVDETATYAGGATTWSNLYSQAVTSNGTGGNLTTHIKTGVAITPAVSPSTTTALRVTYTAPAAGTRTDHHILCYPAPSAPSAGIASSGATPFDGGLIGHVDKGAVHTEWANRCKKTAVAVLTSRKQICLSFGQGESIQVYSWSTKGTGFQPLPPARIYLPNQGPICTIDLRVLGTVSAGVATNLIRVRQVGVAGAKSVFFAASGSIESGTLELKMQGDGLMKYADVEIAVARTAGNTTNLLAVASYYTPGQ